MIAAPKTCFTRLRQFAACTKLCTFTLVSHASLPGMVKQVLEDASVLNCSVCKTFGLDRLFFDLVSRSQSKSEIPQHTLSFG
jgi:hypothetical protein